MKRILRLILLVAAIPLAGCLVAAYVDNTLQDQWKLAITNKFGSQGVNAIAAGKISFQQYCTPVPANSPLCQGRRSAHQLQTAGIAALGVGCGLLLFIFLLGRIASTNRAMLLHSFSPATKFVLLVLSGMIVMQGAIAAYAIYIFEITLSGAVHYVAVGGTVLAALMGALFMISEGMSISKRVSKTAPGLAVSREAQPQLWSLVNHLAQRLGATAPDNIVVGLEPNFYATSAVVIPYPSADAQTGETLFLSLPLMRILSVQELAAVIGHELGHFCGEDTKYALKFYPIYAGTNQALEALQFAGAQSGRMGIALLPAIAILTFLMEQFGRAELAFGRAREFEADKLGASISSPQYMATALLKVGAFTPKWQSMWNAIAAGNIEPARLEQVYSNMSLLSAEIAASSTLQSDFDAVAAIAITHPTDTHPPTGMRIQALDLSLDDMKVKALAIDLDGSSAKIVRDLTGLEQELTKTEHEWRGTARRK